MSGNKSESIDQEVKQMMGKRIGKNKRINSVKKGKSMERDIAKLLTSILGIEICRVPSSGAFSTIHNSELLSGDLMAVHKDAFLPFALEIKHYRLLNLFDVINQNKKTCDIFSWIQQSEEEGRATGKIPYIIFKMNNSQIFVLSQIVNFHNPSTSECKFDYYLTNRQLKIMFFHKNKMYLITPFTNFQMRKMYDDLKAEESGRP